MTEQWQPTSDPLVLHVIPTPSGRGAQREARALADQLHAPGARTHRVLSLFDGPPEVHADLSIRFPPGARPGVGYDPRLTAALRSALRRLAPSLVVAHGGEPLKYLVPAMTRQTTPLVYYAIGTHAGRRDSRLQVWWWRHLAARADAVAAEGYEVQLECTELLHVPPERVTMTPNGRDPGVFYPRPAHRASAAPLIIFVGALTGGKRPHRFVETVAALRERGLAFRAAMVGDGPLHRSLVAPAEAAGVELLGARPDVSDLLRQADLMVFPSRPVGEGMPGVLIEAGLSGLAVVATDVPGVGTIVKNGETGSVVAVDDLTAMVEATARLVGDAGARSAMGRAARQRCLDQFSLESVATSWMGVLGPLLPAGPARRCQAAGRSG